MKLHELLKVKTRPNKRLGRGIGSGKGKTAGRGTKGQKARGSIPVGFSGSNLPFYRKLPRRRGMGNPNLHPKLKTLKLDSLNKFIKNSTVDINELLKANIITEEEAKRGVKILAGELNTALVTNGLVIKLPVSKGAKKMIIKIGGKVENV